jgi:hypothetical protein
VNVTESVLSPIALDESKRLIALEKIIAAGQQTFIEVGIALAEIRDSRLYRCDFKTFEEYCIHKWGWTKQHCYRLIECAPIAKSNPQVTSINQARELAKIPKEKRETVIKTAITKAKTAGRKLTAKDIKVAASPTSEQDIRQRFRAATTKGSTGTWSWWFSRATPEKRGSFFGMILSLHKPVAVEDKEAFTKKVMQWLADEVIETEATP